MAAAVLLSGCLGYQLNNAKPKALKDYHTIAVKLFHNATYVPRVESLVTNTIVKQMQQDGTYKTAPLDEADAVLEGTVKGIGRAPARSLRGNVLATTEFNLTITVNYTLRAKDGRVLASADVSGATSFFVSTDVNTDERQAIPLATEDMAVRLVSQISEGW